MTRDVLKGNFGEYNKSTVNSIYSLFLPFHCALPEGPATKVECNQRPDCYVLSSLVKEKGFRIPEERPRPSLTQSAERRTILLVEVVAEGSCR
jgi:hypothetical protein